MWVVINKMDNILTLYTQNKIADFVQVVYSHSTVAGGLEVIS